MNLTILRPVTGKHLGRLVYLALVRQPVYEENSELKPAKHLLKIDLVFRCLI